MCRVVVRLSKHPAVPPHDFVRSPGRMEFGDGPISARSPTEPLPKSVVSFWNPVSDSSATNVMYRAPEPTIFIAHGDRRSWTFECVAWSFVCRNISPCRRMILFVRPVRWNSAKVRFRREARRGTAAEERRVLRRKAASPEPVVQAGQRLASAFNRRNPSSGNGPRCQDRTVSEMYSGPSLHHASSAFEKIAPEISPLDASNSMRQRRLRDLLGLLRIGAPVPERASETMWNLLNTRFPEQLAQSRIRHDRPVRGGDADLDPSAFSSDSLRISSTLSLNLIRCSRDAFILASSTIRLPRRRSTSSHFEPLGIVPRSTSETPNTA